MRVYIAIGVLLAIGLAGAMGAAADPSVKAGRAFLESLSDAQRRETLLGTRSPFRYEWYYVPKSRLGVSLGQLTAKQTEAAKALLRATLSKLGYEKVESIRSLETVLREIENGNPGRDPDDYHFLFFGEPSERGEWAWRYEGHHVSLTFAFRDGRMIASTPQFLGSNPAEVRFGTRKGERNLGKEKDLSFALMKILTPAQRAKAVIASGAPADIVTGVARVAAIEGHRGLPARELNAMQKNALRELIRIHAEVQSDREQARRLRTVDKEFDDMVFAWMGEVEPNAQHYYRIQGKTVLIEYDNTQPDGNHIHTVWRSAEEDFGADPLFEHYRLGHRATE